jgi:hypothetical protein
MNDGFRNALKEIAAQDVSEIALDPGWPRRIAEAALAALPTDIAPIHLEKARADLAAAISGGSGLAPEDVVAAGALYQREDQRGREVVGLTR